MKNLGKTIDRIIKVDPELGDKLSSIKAKWKKYPSRTLNYWKELLSYLNSEPLMAHPNRQEIKNIISEKSKAAKQPLYSFETLSMSDSVLGTIPENLADILRRYDRQTIEIAKVVVEAGMTRNQELLIAAQRRETILDSKIKRLWIRIKDELKLWDKINVPLSIKKHGSILVIVSPAQSGPSASVLSSSGPGIVKMDSNTLKQFMQFLGLDFPPDNKKEGPDPS